MEDKEAVTFNKEKVANIIKNAVEAVLGFETQYNHLKASQWVNTIIETCMKNLTDMEKPFKYIVTSVILQNNGAGFHCANSCFWEGSDGTYTHKFEEQCSKLAQKDEFQRNGWKWKHSYLQIVKLKNQFEIEYHIVYHPIFKVPTFYFRIMDEEGNIIDQTLQVLSVLKQISLQTIPSFHQQEQTQLNNEELNLLDSHTFITQGEHPQLGTIFYYLHPCNTESVMTLVSPPVENYVLSWASMFGRFLGLEIPKHYF